MRRYLDYDHGLRACWRVHKRWIDPDGRYRREPVVVSVPAEWVRSETLRTLAAWWLRVQRRWMRHER